MVLEQRVPPPPPRTVSSETPLGPAVHPRQLTTNRRRLMTNCGPTSVTECRVPSAVRRYVLSAVRRSVPSAVRCSVPSAHDGSCISSSPMPNLTWMYCWMIGCLLYVGVRIGGGTARGVMRGACRVRSLLGSAADSFPINPPIAFSRYLTGPVAPPPPPGEPVCHGCGIQAPCNW